MGLRLLLGFGVLLSNCVYVENCFAFCEVAYACWNLGLVVWVVGLFCRLGLIGEGGYLRWGVSLWFSLFCIFVSFSSCGFWICCIFMVAFLFGIFGCECWRFPVCCLFLV